MQPLKCSISFLLLLGICHMCLALPRMRVKRQDNLVTLEDEEKDNSLNPINAAEEVSDEGLERNKRKLPEHKAEAKNAILGFVFGHLLSRQARATVTTDKYDGTPDFERTMVSLDFPDELFNQSYKQLSTVSQTVSRFIMNSARRYARFMLFFKPLFGNALVIKGYQDPTTTTTTTTTTTPASASDNEV